MSWNTKWVRGKDYPYWGDTEVYKKTISGGYLVNGESPKDAYRRVAKTVQKDYTNQNQKIGFLIIYGKDGYAQPHLFYQILEQIEDYLSVVLVLMQQIV